MRGCSITGVQRVAYVDIDVHHGDGVQAAFYDDPRVLTISLHQSGRTLFPGTGFPDETGGPQARRLRSRTWHCHQARPTPSWLRAFHAVVPPLLRSFAPEILVSQHGCDSHRLDPLAQLVADRRRPAGCTRRRRTTLRTRSPTAAGSRPVAAATRWREVVPRTWTHLLAIAAGAPIDPATRRRRRRGRRTARSRAPADRAPDIHDRRRVGRLSKFRRGPRSGRSGRPRDHGDHARDVSAARPDLADAEGLAMTALPGPAHARRAARAPRCGRRIAGAVATTAREQPGELRADGESGSGLPLRARTSRTMEFRRRPGADGGAMRRFGGPDLHGRPRHDRSRADRFRMTRRFRRRGARGGLASKARVLVATGHPTGSDGRAPRGGPAVAGRRSTTITRPRPRPGCTVTGMALPVTTSRPSTFSTSRRGQSGCQPVAHPLAAADATDAAADPAPPEISSPDLVIADHGYAGSGRAGRLSSVSSVTPTPTIPRCSSARPRETWRSRCRSTTTSLRPLRPDDGVPGRARLRLRRQSGAPNLALVAPLRRTSPAPGGPSPLPQRRYPQ